MKFLPERRRRYVAAAAQEIWAIAEGTRRDESDRRGRDSRRAVDDAQEGVGMLVLARRVGESIAIGDGIRITVQDIGRTYVRLCVDAPDDVRVERYGASTKSDDNDTVRPAETT